MFRFRRKNKKTLEDIVGQVLEQIKNQSSIIEDATKTMQAAADKMDNHSINYLFYMRANAAAFRILSSNPELLDKYYKEMSSEDSLNEIKRTIFQSQKSTPTSETEG
jgi:hypothetical protein